MPALRVVLLLGTCAALVAADASDPGPADGVLLAFHFDGDFTAVNSSDAVSLVGVNGAGFTDGVRGQAASFSTPGSYLVSSGPLALLPAGAAPRSVALWVRSRSGPLAAVCRNRYPGDSNVDSLCTWDRTVFAGWGVGYVEYGTNAFGYKTAYEELSFDGWDGPSVTSVLQLFGTPNWRHVAFTFDGDVMCLYVDGAPVATTGGASYLVTVANTPLYVSAGWPVGTVLGVTRSNPDIDELYIFNRSLVAAEVAALAHNTWPSATASPTRTSTATLSAPVTPSPSPSPACPPGWVNAGAKCFQLVTLGSDISRTAAQGSCAATSPQSVLASYTSATEQAYVVGAACGVPPVSGPYPFVSIGASLQLSSPTHDRSSNWTWANGQSNAYLLSPPGQSSWCAGEPNNGFGNEFCTEVVAHAPSGACINDMPCASGSPGFGPYFACCAFSAPVPSPTPTPTGTPTSSMTPSVMRTASSTATPSLTATGPATASASAPATPSTMVSPSTSASRTAAASRTSTHSGTPSGPPTPTPTFPPCAVGWTQVGGKCFQYTGAGAADPLSAAGAQAACAETSPPSSLASFATDAEAAYVVAGTCGAPAGTNVLIGAVLSPASPTHTVTSNWTWADSSSAAFLQSPGGQAAWCGGEPNNYNGVEFCSQARNDGCVNDVPCDGSSTGTGMSTFACCNYLVRAYATATPVPAATQGPHAAALFHSTSVLALRVGNASVSAVGAAAGRAMPVFIDEYDATGTLAGPGPVSTVSLPPASCTLAVGRTATNWYDTEGFPALSADGARVSFGCYAVAVGAVIADSPATVKTLALLAPDGGVDVSTTVAHPWGATAGQYRVALRSVVTAGAGAGFYVSGAPGNVGAGYGGVYFQAAGGTAGAEVPIAVGTVAGAFAAHDAGCLGIFGGTLFGTDSPTDAGASGVSILGSSGGPLPTSVVAPTLVSGTGTSGAAALFTFAFDALARAWLYVADPGDLVIRGYSSNGAGYWGWNEDIQLDPVLPVYSIAAAAPSGPGCPVLYAATAVALWRYDTCTGATALLATAPAGGVFRGVALAPVDAAFATPSALATATQTATPTAASTASVTPTPVATASRTPTAAATASRTPPQTPSPTASAPVATFQPTSVLVLRVGDAAHALTTATVGLAHPLYVDEFDPTGLFGGDAWGADTPASTVALPPGACTLSHGGAGTPYWYDTEGFPSLSTDGARVSLGCYCVAVGASIVDAATAAAATVKTLASLGADGSVDVSTTTRYPFAGTYAFPVALRTALALPAAASPFGVDGFYFAAAPGYFHRASGGVFWQARGAGPGAEVLIGGGLGLGYVGARDGRALAVVGGQLFATSGAGDAGCNGVSVLGTSGLPTADVPSAALSGTVAGSPWGFVFDTADIGGSVWVADSSNLGAYNVVNYAVVNGTWAAVDSLSFDTVNAVYSLAGRYEALPANSGCIVLYAVTAAALWRADTCLFGPAGSAGYGAGVRTAVLATAPAGTAFRGVVAAPVNAGMVPPTPFASHSASASASASATTSASTSASASRTASASATASFTRTSTSTPTATRTVAVALYRSSSVLVVAVGSAARSAATAATGAALPVAVIEFDTTGAVTGPVSTTAMPPSCALARGTTPAHSFDTEGLPTLSADGASVSVGCHAVTAGASIVDATFPLKTLALVGADGFVDASTTTWAPFGATNASSGEALHGALFVPTPGGPGFVVSAPPATPGTYLPVGVQTNVPASSLVGWTQCFVDDYADPSYPSIAGLLAACTGAHLMLACRPTGTTTLTVLAQAPRSDVLFDTGTSNTPHVANGVGWYFSADWSWGFAPQGDTILRATCDVESGGSNERLCWHTGAGNGGASGQIDPGWSCGAATYLQEDPGTYERVVFQSTPAPAVGALLWQPLGGGLTALSALPEARGAGVGIADARCLGAFNGTLYATDSGADTGFNGVSALGALAAMGANANVSAAVLPGTTTVGTAAASPWAFSFESATSLWTADDGAPAAYNLVHYVAPRAAAPWAVVKTVLLPAGAGIQQVVYSITGRYEAARSSFVVYAVSTMSLWAYVTATGAVTALASAPTGSVFRGVVTAPINPLMRAPTPFATTSSTATPPATPSHSRAPTSVPPPSHSGTASRTPSHTGTATRTGTRTAVASRSNPPTPSPTPSGTRSATATRSATKSATGMRSSTRSQKAK